MASNRCWTYDLLMPYWCFAQHWTKRAFCWMSWLLRLSQNGLSQNGLSQNQTGDVNGECGVKQGDVISPLLFNAGLEHAMRILKLRLQHCGFDLGNGEILTNGRYAGDLMLYAKHCDDLVFMMEIVIEELSALGPHLNTSKTKILTTHGFDRPYVPGCWWRYD